MAKSKSLRQQYIQESKYIRRRLSDIEKRMPDSMIVQRYKNEFPGVKDLGPTSDAGFRMALKEIRKLRESGQLSVSSQRRSKAGAIATLNARGYTFVNDENFDPLFRFLDDARARGLTSIYGYTQLLTAFDRAVKRGLTEDEIKGNIEYWANNADKEKPQRLTVRRGRSPASSANISKRIKK